MADPIKDPKMSWNNSGHPGMSYQIRLPSPGPRSPGTTQDIPGYPTKHDNQSPRLKNSKKSWDNSGHFITSQDVLPDMTTKVSGPKIPRSPWKSWDILGCFDG